MPAQSSLDHRSGCQRSCESAFDQHAMLQHTDAVVTQLPLMRDPMGVVPEPALAVPPALLHDAEVFFSEFAETQVAALIIAHVWRCTTRM